MALENVDGNTTAATRLVRPIASHHTEVRMYTSKASLAIRQVPLLSSTHSALIRVDRASGFMRLEHVRSQTALITSAFLSRLWFTSPFWMYVRDTIAWSKSSIATWIIEALIELFHNLATLFVLFDMSACREYVWCDSVVVVARIAVQVHYFDVWGAHAH